MLELPGWLIPTTSECLEHVRYCFSIASSFGDTVLAPIAAIQVTLTTGAVVGIVLGVIISIFVSVFARRTVEYIDRPLLEIGNFQSEDRYEGDRTFLSVSNTGNSAARNCSGRLTINGQKLSLLPRSPGDAEPPLREHTTNGGKIDANLCWTASENIYRRTLNVGDEEILGIFQCFSDGIIVPSEDGWESPTAVLNPDSDQYDEPVELTVRVSAENCEPVQRSWLVEIVQGDVVPLDEASR